MDQPYYSVHGSKWKPRWRRCDRVPEITLTSLCVITSFTWSLSFSRVKVLCM